MFILSELGTAILKYEDEFNRLLKGAGLRNPIGAHFADLKDHFKFTENGFVITDDLLAMSEDEIKEREMYSHYKNKYIAERIFEDFGYGTIMNSLYKDSFEWQRPCLGGDGQCHLDCVLKGGCYDES